MRGLMGSFFQPLEWLSAKGSLQRKAVQVKAVYRLLDQAADKFRFQAGINCVTGCGVCCYNSSVEATELEMLPLAFRLVRSSMAEEWYQRAEAMSFRGRCVFYTSDSRMGKCYFYAYRPLVCRLFGYAGNKDKYGRPRLVTCSVLKRDQPQATEKALDRVFHGELCPPIMSDLVMRLSSVDPEMSRDSMPVNLAFKRAVERVSLNQRFSRKKD